MRTGTLVQLTWIATTVAGTATGFFFGTQGSITTGVIRAQRIELGPPGCVPGIVLEVDGKGVSRIGLRPIVGEEGYKRFSFEVTDSLFSDPRLVLQPAADGNGDGSIELTFRGGPAAPRITVEDPEGKRRLHLQAGHNVGVGTFGVWNEDGALLVGDSE